MNTTGDNAMHTYHITIVWLSGKIYSKLAPTVTQLSIEDLTDILKSAYADQYQSITVAEMFT